MTDVLADALTIGFTTVDVNNWNGCQAVRKRDKPISVELSGRVDEATLVEFVKILEGASLRSYTPTQMMDFWLIADGLKNVDLCEAIEVSLQTHENLQHVNE